MLQRQCDKLQKELKQCKQQKLGAEKKHEEQIVQLR